MANVPLTIRFMAAKDGSFDRVASEVEKRISDFKNSKLLPGADEASQKALADATQQLARMQQQLDQVREKAARTAAELAKLRAGGGVSAPSTPKSPSPSGKTLPEEIAAQAKAAGESLTALQGKLKAVASTGTGTERIKGLQTGAIDLARFRQENSQLLSAVPQLRQQYSQVAGQIQISAAEARQLAKAESDAAAQARNLANEQKRGAVEAEKASGTLREGLKSLADVGRSIGLTIGGAGASMLGLATLATRTAGTFELLQARLGGVVKNADQANQLFAKAVSFAALTPFGVGGLVQATATLAAFQQNARAVLPELADLSAGLGEGIEQEAIRFSKALSGAAEGYESFREAGISNSALKAAGAELNNTGTVALITAGQIEKAAEALRKVIHLRFDGAAEKQARTLQGALSNLFDTLERAGAAFGKYLIPVARVGTEQLSRFLGVVEGLPAGLQGTIAVGTLAAGVLTTLAGGAIFAGSHLVNLGVQMLELKSRLPDKAVEALTLRFGGLANSAKGIVNSGLGRFFLGATGALLGLGAAAAIADTAMQLYLESLRQTDEAVVNSAKSYHDAFTSARTYSDLVNKIGNKEFLTGTSQASQATVELAATLKGVPLPQLVGGLQSAGVSLKDLKRDLEANSASTEAFTERQKKLQALLKDENGRQRPDQVLDGFALVTNKVDIPPELQGFFSGKAQASVAEVRKELQGVDLAVMKLGADAVVLGGLKKAFDDFAGPLNEGIEKSKLLNNYLEFSERSKSLLALQSNLKLVSEDLSNLQAKAKQAQLPTTEAGALERLKVAQGDEITFQRALIGRFEDQKKARAALANYERELREESLIELDRQRAREKADSDATLDSKASDLKAEKVYLQQRMQLVRGAVEEEISLTKQLQALRKQKPNIAREAAIEDIQERLKAVREAATEEVETRQKVRDNDKAILAQQVTEAKNALDEQTKASLEFVKKEKANGASSPEILRAYDRIILRLQLWKNAHGPLLQQSHELRAAFQGIQSQVDAGTRSEKADKGKTALQETKGKLDESLAAEVNLVEKKRLITAAIKAIEDGITTGTYTRKQAESELISLRKQETEIGKQVDQQQARFAIERLNLERGALDQEIAILDQRKAAGQNVETQLTELRRKRLQAALNAIQLEANAEREAKGDETQIQAKSKAATEALLRQAYLDQVSQWQQEEAAAQEHQDKLDAIKANRIGGSRSPIQSAEEAFADLSALDFDLDSGFKKQRRKPPTPLDVAAKLGLDARAANLLQSSVQDPIYRQSQLRQVGIPDSLRLQLEASKKGPNIDRLRGANETQGTAQAKKAADEKQSEEDSMNRGSRNTQVFQATVNGLQVTDTKFKDAVLTIMKYAYGEAVNRNG